MYKDWKVLSRCQDTRSLVGLDKLVQVWYPDLEVQQQQEQVQVTYLWLMFDLKTRGQLNKEKFRTLVNKYRAFIDQSPHQVVRRYCERDH